jgi:cytochrome c oxidase subunit 2
VAWRVAAVATFVSGAAACRAGEGADSAVDAGQGSDVSIAVADEVARGEQLAQDSGCQACHRAGGGGVGPDWEGRYGSEVELDDGTTVIADDAYLTLAITDPRAQVVAGYAVAMPEYPQLSDSDVAAIVAYIRSLSGSTDRPAVTGAP